MIADVLHSFFLRQSFVMYRFGCALNGDTFWLPIRTSVHKKKWSGRTRQALRSVITYFKYSYQPRRKFKKVLCFIGTSRVENTLGVPHYPQ